MHEDTAASQCLLTPSCTQDLSELTNPGDPTAQGTQDSEVLSGGRAGGAWFHIHLLPTPHHFIPASTNPSAQLCGQTDVKQLQVVMDLVCSEWGISVFSSAITPVHEEDFLVSLVGCFPPLLPDTARGAFPEQSPHLSDHPRPMAWCCDPQQGGKPYKVHGKHSETHHLYSHKGS